MKDTLINRCKKQTPKLAWGSEIGGDMNRHTPPVIMR